MILFSRGSADDELNRSDLLEGLYFALGKLGPHRKVLAIPPDFTRFHSFAGQLTRFAYDFYGDRLTDILPALGTHRPMSREEIETMFPGVPLDRFRVHDWRSGTATLGHVPADFVRSVSEGRVAYSWPAQVSNWLAEGGHDLILSIGQVVPHEVAGMANYNKNIFVGTGGAEGINKSHFLGAVYGMERIMGRANNPVRALYDYASDYFATDLPILYILTVVGLNDEGELVVRGLFIGDDKETFLKASDLALQVNVSFLDEPLKKVVVYLDPGEYKSTWLGNKSVYRTRMAIADGGELIVLAPGVTQFGEDRKIDRLIRKYGYGGALKILELVKENDDLRNNLSAAAHLIHGSSEGRFSITYCPGRLTREEIESVGFRYAELSPMLQRYDPEKLVEGFNTLPDGEKVFFISNPALGLWAWKERFEQSGWER